MRKTWDIFCKVIDNYGDIGIAWRLARQLVAEHGVTVRLWVDNLHAFRRIWPEIDPAAESQRRSGVEVRAWREPFAAVRPARVVIEAFGCALPEPYLAAMSAQSPAPVWINLEYLSAEAWVTTHHGLPSPHPRLPLTKFFFFPGYQKGTGGVLRERDLASRRERFQREEATAFWRALGLAAPAQHEVRISMFAYPNPALTGLLDAWAHGGQAVSCLVPEGRLLPLVAAWLNQPALPVNSAWRRGSLELRILPFLNHDDYDRLLWGCDINFVRGEDSCVRAQWASRPFVWQAYPQADDAHFAKLDALAQRYVQGLPETAAAAVTAMWQAWNGRGDIARAWIGFNEARLQLTAHAGRWTARLAETGDLAASLVAFVEQRFVEPGDAG